MPNKPKTRKITLDKIETKEGFKCLDKNFPQKIASKLLIHIPKIEPQIKENL